jgi:hypothetical protein
MNMRVDIDRWERTAMLAALAFTVAGCVAKPPFRCTTNESCISPNGSKGVCDQTGSCDFSKAPSDKPGTDAGADTGADTVSCVVDPVRGCYPCAPTTSEEVVNACTSSTCVPFDDATRLTKLSPGGGLPPLPN